MIFSSGTSLKFRVLGCLGFWGTSLKFRVTRPSLLIHPNLNPHDPEGSGKSELGSGRHYNLGAVIFGGWGE